MTDSPTRAAQEQNKSGTVLHPQAASFGNMDSACNNSLMWKSEVAATYVQSLQKCTKNTPLTNCNHEMDWTLAQKVSSELRKHVVLPWITVPHEDGITVLLLSRDEEMSVQRRVFFSLNGTVLVSVHRKPITGTLLESILLSDRSKDFETEVKNNWRIFVENAVGVIKRLKSFEVCVGVDEEEYKPLWEIDKLGEVDNNPYGEVRYKSTYRPFACHILVPTVNHLKRRCAVCIQTKIRFRVKMQRHLSPVALPSTSNAYLDRNQLLTKVQKQKRSLKDSRHQIVKLRAKLQHVLSLHKLKVEESLCKDMVDILMDYISVQDS